MNKIKRFIPLVFLAAAILSGCNMVSIYEPPKDKEPYALLKLKFKYSGVLPNTTLGARMNIRHDAKSDSDSFYSALNNSYGVIQNKKTRHKIPMEGIKIHPGKKTDMQMAVYFYWYTTQTYTTFINNVPMVQTQQVYNEEACTAQVSFTPQAGKVYLLDYTNANINDGCKATAYKQTKLKNGKFRLKLVAKSKKV